MRELSTMVDKSAAESTDVPSAANEIVMGDRLIDQAIRYFGDTDKAAIKIFSQYINGSDQTRDALVAALSLRVCMLTAQLRGKQ